MAIKADRSAWLKGGDAVCETRPPAHTRPVHLILLGAPGVGKGTQASLLAEELGMCHLSTGDVFRGAKCLCDGERSPGLTAALEYMKRGDLVPDETVLDIVRERAACMKCTAGFLLDGFPRTVPQAEALDEILAANDISLDAVVNYDIPLEMVVARLGGRRTCSKCKAVFHVQTLPPKVDGICDHCGAELIIREDDRPESIRVRLAAYQDATSPLIEYYGRKGQLVTVKAEGTPEAIFQSSMAILRDRLPDVPELQPQE